MLKNPWGLVQISSSNLTRMWVHVECHSDKVCLLGSDANVSKLGANSGLIGSRGDVGKLASLSFVSGAVLGPICDGFHSAHNVLHYTDPSILAFPSVRYATLAVPKKLLYFQAPGTHKCQESLWDMLFSSVHWTLPLPPELLVKAV